MANTPAEGPVGAVMQPEYMGRKMKCYPVHDSEMEMLSTLNTQATAFFSLATGAAGYAISIWTDAAFEEKMTQAAKVATGQLAPAAILVAIVFLGLGLHAAWRRRGLWGRIKRESTTVQTTIS